jgi:regulator of protease activity HflC (stomatin/prohibitin superfamily)
MIIRYCAITFNSMDDYSDYGEQSNREKWMNRFKWGAAVAGGIALAGCRIVRPNQLGLMEIFGKYHRTVQPGLRWMPPFGIGRLRRMPMDMRKVEVPGQSIITKEQLNAEVDAVVYYQVHDPVKAAYHVQDYANTVPTLAQTTLRNELGKRTLAEANRHRQHINASLKSELHDQIDGTSRSRSGRRCHSCQSESNCGCTEDGVYGG